MNCNKKRIVILVFLSLSLALCLTNFIGFQGEPGLLGIMFSVLGVVFSFGICIANSLNLERIRNPDYYEPLKRSTNVVRDTSAVLFALVLVLFVLSQIMRTVNIGDEVNFLGLVFSFSSFAFSFNCFVLLYYVLNFGRLQSLDQEIEERMRED